MSEELQESVDETQIDEVQVQPEQEQPHETASRPEWLPEKFKSEEDFAKSYEHLERRLHERSDNFKQEIMEELQSEAAADVPVSPADYQVLLETEEGEPFEVVEDDMLEWWKHTAHSLGLNQQQFNGILAEYSQMDMMRGPDWNEESEKLGEYSEQRMQRIDAWAGANLSEGSYEVFANLPASAGMVQFFEELMENNGQPRFNMVSDTQFQEHVTQDDLKSAMADPAYWRDRDPAHIAKVQAMAKQVGLQKHGSLTVG